MKKLILILVITLLCGSLYAKSYEEFLTEGKNYEARGKLCHALVSYYDAAALEIPVEQKLEAYDCYKKLSELIKSGKITENEPDEFESHRLWKDLVDDAMQFKRHFPKYEIIVGSIVRNSINYTEKTVTYGLEINYREQKKYSTIMEIINTGINSAKKSDWQDICWDIDSVYCSKIEDYSVLLVVSDCDGNKLFEKGEKLRESNNYQNEYYCRNYSVVFPQQIEMIQDGKVKIEIIEYYFNGSVYICDETIKNILDEKEFIEYREKERLLKLVKENKINLKDNDLINIPGINIKMLRTEVTQELYESVMGENPSEFIGKEFPVERVSWYDAIYFCNLLSYAYGLEPVYSINDISMPVNWDYTPHKGHNAEFSVDGHVRTKPDANGFRLPKVSEWQYAAKGGQDYKYAGSNNLDEVAWYSDNSDNKSHPVAQKKPNGYGLHDMSGNVCEWCRDRKESYRYICGGSSIDVISCEVSRNSIDDVRTQYRRIGFRIVCSADE